VEAHLRTHYFFKISITLLSSHGYKGQEEFKSQKLTQGGIKMDDEKLTKRLEDFDFSLLHPVRETLRNQLLFMHRRDNAMKGIMMGKMTDDELDMVVAAGNPAIKNIDNKNK
jgi:hypothetical protein